MPSQPDASAFHVPYTATIMPTSWPTVNPIPRHASARSRNLSGMRSPNAAASGMDTSAYPTNVSSQKNPTSWMSSHADRIATLAAVSSVPPMIHGMRRPSGPNVWSEPTATHAFMKKVTTVPSPMSHARDVTPPFSVPPAIRPTSCGTSTVLSAAMGAVNSSAPSVKPAISRRTCVLSGVVPSGAVIGSRRSRKDDSRFGTAASRCAAAVSGEPPSALMRAACTSGRSFEASGTRGFCCTASRFSAALASSVSVFS